MNVDLGDYLSNERRWVIMSFDGLETHELRSLLAKADVIYALDAKTRQNYLVYGRKNTPGTRLHVALNIETDELQTLLTAIQKLRGHHDYIPQRQPSGPQRGQHGKEKTPQQYTILCEATVHLTAEADSPEEALKVWQRWRSQCDHVPIDNDAVVILADSSPRVLDSNMKVVRVEKGSEAETR